MIFIDAFLHFQYWHLSFSDLQFYKEAIIFSYLIIDEQSVHTYAYA